MGSHTFVLYPDMSPKWDLHQDTLSWNKRSQSPFAYFKKYFDDFVSSQSFKSCQLTMTVSTNEKSQFLQYW